jgi:hypothetical protein
MSSVKPAPTIHPQTVSTSRYGATLDGRTILDPAVLKRLRQVLALSQEALANLCVDRHLRVSLASIKRAEAGKPVIYRTARQLALALGKDLPALQIPLTLLVGEKSEKSAYLSLYPNFVAQPTQLRMASVYWG